MPEAKDTKNTQEERVKARIAFLKKKNNARAMLDKKGIMKRSGTNDFDHYQYFSEAQYKKLFTELFSKNGLEMSCEEVAIQDIQGTDKQPFGCRITMAFTLTDIDTGYSETTHSTGTGFDKGDKALYKAKTGALKYWLANNWMVATGDDPEKADEDDGENGPQNGQIKPQAKATVKTSAKPATALRLATESQIGLINKLYTLEELQAALDGCHVNSVKDLTIRQASDLISAKKGS